MLRHRLACLTDCGGTSKNRGRTELILRTRSDYDGQTANDLIQVAAGGNGLSHGTS
jgi:hypothetical protein